MKRLTTAIYILPKTVIKLLYKRVKYRPSSSHKSGKSNCLMTKYSTAKSSRFKFMAVTSQYKSKDMTKVGFFFQ